MLLERLVFNPLVYEEVAKEVMEMANDQDEALSDQEVADDSLDDEQVEERRPNKRIRVIQEKMVKDEKPKKAFQIVKMRTNIEKVLKIVDLFHIPDITINQVILRAFPMFLTGAASHWLRNKPSSLITTWEDLKTNFLSKYYPPAYTAKKIKVINNFQQEPNENLYQAWEQFKELLMKCPQHYLIEMQEVVLFYNRLDVPTRWILDSKGAIPSKTTANAKVAIQEMAEYSQKWHNGRSRTRSTKTSDGLAGMQAQLNNLRREIKKVNEKVYAAQERGFGSLSSSTETNPRDHVKSISTILKLIHTRYTVWDPPNTSYPLDETCILMYEKKQMTIPFLSHLNGKEKDPGSFTLPCFINNVCFDNALADLGANDYIELHDLNVPLELTRDQVDDSMPTIEEGKVVEEFRAWNDARMVKDNKEKDKIRAKPDKIKSKQEARKSPDSSPTKSNPSQSQENIKLRFDYRDSASLRNDPGILRDKIICDLDKTPDLSQRSPQNCPKCGNPVDGHYCQGCALLRKKFKEDIFTYCIENGILQDSFEPSNDNTNVVNAPRGPFVVNQDPGENSSQSPPQINHHCCYGCCDPLEEIFCHQCTCELCGNGALYGYNCPPKVPIVPNSEPFNNQTIKEFPPTMQSFDPKSNLVHDSPNVFDPPSQLPFILVNSAGTMLVMVTIIHRKVTHEAYQCQPINEDYYHEQNSCYDPNSFGFDQFQPQQYTVNHPIFNSQNDIFDSQNKLMEQLTSIDDQSFSNKDFLKEIYSNPLFDEEIISIKIDPHHFNTESGLIESLLNHDSSIISSSKIDSLFDEFTEFISENSDAIESFSPSPIPVEDSDSLMEEIVLSFTPDYPMSSGIEEDDYDSERDILILD
uniref:Retrotransposon gag domain-containing protein n=1 Tax=Tanacetum cinerariifolium TaxID=118510 RepID=A0A6L2N0M7_TANCI|nr:hypothetical protein [Tanacetum cinerariifolium]